MTLQRWKPFARGMQTSWMEPDTCGDWVKAAEAEAEIERLREYVGTEMVMSDFQTAGQMRLALDQARAENERLRAHNSNADDSEPITREWLRSIGSQPVASDLGTKKADHEYIRGLRFWEMNDKVWLFYEADSYDLRTRGQLRHLFAALKPGGEE